MGKPLNAWRRGKLDMAAWKNDSGQISFTFRKCYKDKTTGEFKETKYLWPSDIDDLAELAQEVKGWWASREAHNVEHQTSGGFNDTQATQDAMVDDDIPF